MKNKILIILSGLLFLSASYNFWWVMYERTNTENTIYSLNNYIEMSRNIIESQEELRQSTAEFAEIYVDGVNRCAEGQPVDDLITKVDVVTSRMKTEREQLEQLFTKRTEFANTSGLSVSN